MDIDIRDETFGCACKLLLVDVSTMKPSSVLAACQDLLKCFVIGKLGCAWVLQDCS